MHEGTEFFPPAPTGAPGGLTSSSVKSRSLTVLWGKVPCPNQRGPITGYRLRYSNGTSIVNTTGLTHILTGLTPFTSYSVQVAAVNAGGTGPYSESPLTVETLQGDTTTPVVPLAVILAISLMGNIITIMVIILLVMWRKHSVDREK